MILIRVINPCASAQSISFAPLLVSFQLTTIWPSVFVLELCPLTVTRLDPSLTSDVSTVLGALFLFVSLNVSPVTRNFKAIASIQVG